MPGPLSWKEQLAKLADSPIAGGLNPLGGLARAVGGPSEQTQERIADTLAEPRTGAEQLHDPLAGAVNPIGAMAGADGPLGGGLNPLREVAHAGGGAINHALAGPVGSALGMLYPEIAPLAAHARAGEEGANDHRREATSMTFGDPRKGAVFATPSAGGGGGMGGPAKPSANQADLDVLKQKPQWQRTGETTSTSAPQTPEEMQAELMRRQAGERDVEAQGYRTYAERIAKDAADADRLAKERADALERDQHTIDGLSREAADMKIDPDRMSDGRRIGFAISAFLGGALQGLNGGGPNMGLEAMNSYLDRDIDSQREAIKAKRGQIADMQGALANNMRRFGDLATAEAATRVQNLSALENKQKAMATEAGTHTAFQQSAILSQQIRDSQLAAAQDFQEKRANSEAKRALQQAQTEKVQLENEKERGKMAAAASGGGGAAPSKLDKKQEAAIRKQLATNEHTVGALEHFRSERGGLGGLLGLGAGYHAAKGELTQAKMEEMQAGGVRPTVAHMPAIEETMPGGMSLGGDADLARQIAAKRAEAARLRAMLGEGGEESAGGGGRLDGAEHVGSVDEE